ncbi:MAG: c-type cytochrome [Chloroflexi bacterium]|nr:c-type cytochrome [Chloroflexota bacterium]
MPRSLIPPAAFGIVLAIALILIFQITLRPWAGPNTGWDTHFNYGADIPPGYSRSQVAYLSQDDTAPAGWRASHAVDALKGVEQGRGLYVATGCASCHGLDGAGGPGAPSVLGNNARRLRTLIRQGNGGMPLYHEEDLPPDQIELIASFIESLGPAPKPAPTPAPTPTQVPVASATPMPLAGLATPTPFPDVPAATPSPIPEPKPSVDPEAVRAGRSLYVDLGCDLCHGAQAEGGEKAPGLADLTAAKIRDQVREPQRGTDSPYPRAMKPVSRDALTDAELELIVQFLLSLN